MIAREKDIPYGSKGYPFLGPPCHPVTVSPTCAKKNKGSLSENIDNPLLTSPRVDVIQGNTIALFFLVMAAGGYGRPCERTVTLRGKPAGEGRPGRKMRARAASPFPEPFMQYKETQMNTRGFSLVREDYTGDAFVEFLKQADRRYPQRYDIVLVLEKCWIYRTKEVLEYLAGCRKGRFHFVCEHKNAFWLNLVECFLTKLTRHAFAEMRAPDKKTLIRQVARWLVELNHEPWHFVGREVRRKSPACFASTSEFLNSGFSIT